MKINFLAVIAILLTLSFGCSSESTEVATPDTTSETDTPDTTSDTPTNQNVIKFIKKIIPENPESYQLGTQFFYDNDKLTYIYISSCYGTLHYFEYNNDGKISKRYSTSKISFDGDNFNPDTFDINTFKQNSSILNYVYEGGKLIIMQENETFIDYHLSYNGDGLVEVVEWISPSGGLKEKVVVTYSNGKISNLNKKEYDTDGSLWDNYNYTFEYDDNPNPFYIIFENFSLLSLITCTGFDYISSEDMALKLFANNVKTVNRDGQLLYSATYQYDSDNYPIRISYTNLNGDYSDIQLITYIE